MTKRQQAAARTREKLVETAKELICKKGLSETSVDEITEKCGVAKGTFYTYFKRKEDIVFELSGRMFGEILEKAKNRAGSFLEKLEYYLCSFSGYIEKKQFETVPGVGKKCCTPRPRDGLRQRKTAKRSRRPARTFPFRRSARRAESGHARRGTCGHAQRSFIRRNALLVHCRWRIQL